MPGPYTRVSAGNPGNSGATAATTIVNAHSAGLEALERGVYNVRDYGALGDGVTNDTAAIEAACTALNASTYGGVLLFPAGTYRTSGGHSVLKGVIAGQGQASSRIIGVGTAHIFTISTCVAVRDLYAIHDAFWSGTLVRPTAGSFIRINPGLAQGVQTQDYLSTDNHFSNLTVAGFYDNFSFRNAARFVIEGCTLSVATRHGIHVRNPDYADFGDFAISDCTLVGAANVPSSGAHIYWESGGGMKVTNCKIMGGVGWCIDVAWKDGTSGDVSISNCSIENFTAGGIRITTDGAAFERGTLTGNQIASFEGGDAGIYMDGVNGALNGFTVVGNQFASINKAIVLRNIAGVTIAGNQAYATTFLETVNVTNLRNLDV